MAMTDRDKKLLAIFAVVVVLGGYWFLILGGKRSAVAEAEEAVRSAQSDLDSAEAAANQGKIEKKRFPVSYARVLRMGKAIPVDSDFPSLLVQVNDVAEDAGVNFLSLTASDGAADGTTETGATGTTTCEAEAEAPAAPAATGSTGATPESPTGSTGSTAKSGVGRARDKATDAKDAASADATRADQEEAELKVKCASSPTLTDVTAQAAGLRVFSYNFAFEGSFFDLYKVYNGLLDMVKVKNGKINVTGRLLEINSISTSVKSFPELSANVSMTGYALPVGSTIAAGATATGPAGTTTESAEKPAPSSDTPAAGANGGSPPAAIVGVK